MDCMASSINLVFIKKNEITGVDFHRLNQFQTIVIF